MSGRGIPLSSRLSSLSLRSQSVSIKSCQKTDPPPETLKIKEFRQEIIDKVNNNQVTLISAETGSGKVIKYPIVIVAVFLIDFFSVHSSSTVHYG